VFCMDSMDSEAPCFLWILLRHSFYCTMLQTLVNGIRHFRGSADRGVIFASSAGHTFQESFCWQQFAAGRSRRPLDFFRSNAKLLENMVMTIKDSGWHSYARLLEIQRQCDVFLPLHFTSRRPTCST
jgi:hypothetical protein